MKSFGTKEITDEIIELDDLAKKKVLFPSLRFGLGAHVLKTKKKSLFFLDRKNLPEKKGLFPV